ncbi:MAG: hypothetical protein P4L56_05965 [Candidatus Sulfopaludibacter sp.]|nr:hypothetical protein [Candidatus Sulfopaludibacter sp.]
MRTLLLLLLVLPGLSAQGENWCRNGLFADDQNDMRPARIIGTGAVSLYQDSTPGCPQKGAACKEADGPPPGTQVLVSKVHDGFACVWQSIDAVGWIPAARVDLSLPFDRNPPLAAWAGDWKFFDNHLQIAVAPDGRRLRIGGNAFWHGLNTTHDGSIEGEAVPSGNRLSFQSPPGDCKVRLALVNHTLAATDNRVCGGMNVTFTGIYEPAHGPFEAQSASIMQYGRTADGQDTVDITNVTFELVQMSDERRLMLRKTHSEHNVIGDEGGDPKITVEAWPLGVNLKEKPLYGVTLAGQDAAPIDDALLVFDRTEEIPWWSVYHLDSGKHFFDTYAPLLRFSLTDPEQTGRYVGLEVSNDETADKRLKAPGVVGVLTYASGDRVIREALVTCDTAARAETLHSLADTTFALAFAGKAIRLTLTPFGSSATVITVPLVNDDLDLAHARIPAGIHLAAWKR